VDRGQISKACFSWKRRFADAGPAAIYAVQAAIAALHARAANYKDTDGGRSPA